MTTIGAVEYSCIITSSAFAYVLVNMLQANVCGPSVLSQFTTCVAAVVLVHSVAFPLGLSRLAWVALGMQWIAYLPACYWQTEIFYDLTGSISFVTQMVLALMQSEQHPRQKLAGLLTLGWAFRLGGFLFNRIMITGKDKRFDKVRNRPAVFLQFWTIQGVWVFLTSLPVLILATKKGTSDWKFPETTDLAGVGVWLLGFGIEVLADWQKYQFQNDWQTRDTWINVGLWKYSRHPNYAGEIILWTGTFIVAAGSFTQWLDWMGILGPIFVALLLGKVSTPMTEQGASKRWGGEKKYQDYLRTTPAIFPFWP